MILANADWGGLSAVAVDGGFRPIFCLLCGIH